MRFKCSDCGTVFTEDEAELAEEDRGSFWGFPAYETIMLCPVCRSDDFEETEEAEDD